MQPQTAHMLHPQLGANATTSVLSLTAPWPRGLGRASLTAARAVREAGNVSIVSFVASADERRKLLHLAGNRVRVEASDASDFYESRARDDTHGRRLGAGRISPGLPLPLPLQGSMGGYYTCAARLVEPSARPRAPLRLGLPPCAPVAGANQERSAAIGVDVTISCYDGRRAASKRGVL